MTLLADLPAAGLYTGASAYVSDAGLVVSTGVAWVPISTLVFKNYASDHILGVPDLTGVSLISPDPINLIIPISTDVLFPPGIVLPVEQGGVGKLTIAPAAGVTLRSRDSVFSLAGQYAVANLRYVGSDEWRLAGDLA